MTDDAHHIVVQSANNMPVQAPLIPHPFVPYHCPGNRTLYAVCRGDEAVLRAMLAPTPFELADDRFVVSVSDFSNCDKTAFMDAAIVLPVRFGELAGGNYLFEYENNDAAIAAGRDLWGYPKKYARILMARDGDTVSARVERDGTRLMEIVCHLRAGAAPPERPVVTPHLNLHLQPAPDGPGWISRRVIARDTSPDFELSSDEAGHVEVHLGELPGHPLACLQPREVLGGGLVSGDFHATERNGWGRVVANLD